MILSLVGNIRVFCRCRPLNAEEIAAQASMAIDFDSAKEHELMVKANGAPKRVFKFDAVFGPQADQGNTRFHAISKSASPDRTWYTNFSSYKDFYT